MHERTGIVLLISVVLMCTFSAIAAGEEFLTLQRAITLAYERNPRMAEARKMIDGAKGEMISQSALPDPEVEFEISGLEENDEGVRSPRLGSFEVRQSFGPIAAYGLKTGVAKNRLRAQKESLKSVWADVYTTLREVYARSILDKKRIELASGNLDIYRRFYSQVELKYQSGKALKNDLQRARIELLKAENEYLVAENNQKQDKARLNLMLGRPMDFAFSIEEDIKEQNITATLKEVTDIALAMSPELKTEELLLKAEEQNLTKEQLSRLPSPYVGFKNINETYDKDQAIVIGATFPLWGLNQGEVKKARAARDIQKIRAEAAKRCVVFDAYEAYLDVELKLRQFDLLKKSLEEANELLRLADLSYSEGGIDFVNFLDQVRTATGTRMGYYEGLFELNNAVNRLEKVMYTSLRKEEYLK